MTILLRHASRPPKHLYGADRLEWLRLLREFTRNERALREIDDRRHQIGVQNYGRLTKGTLDLLAKLEARLEALEREPEA